METTTTPTPTETPAARKWRRMHRFPLITLLLIAAVSALWVRSEHRSDTLIICLHHGIAQGIVCDRGRFCAFASNIHCGVERQWSLLHWSQDAGAGEIAAASMSDEIDWSKSGFDFSIGHSRTGAMGISEAEFGYIVAPFWPLIVLLAIPSLFFIRIILRDRLRLRRGCCVACGYDLRGIRERCPECGEPVPLPRIRGDATLHLADAPPKDADMSIGR